MLLIPVVYCSFLGAVLEEYSSVRNKDAEAICDLSMYNYLEVIE